MNVLTTLAASEVSLFDVNSWWWAIQKGLYWIVAAIQDAYNYLVGITPVSNSADKPDTNISGDVLFNLFSDSRVTRIWLGFMIFAAVFLIIFLIIGFIKVHFKNEDQLASRGKMLSKSFGAFLTMLFLPMIMFVAVYFVGFLFQFISAAMNAAIGTTGGDTEIANIIHNICIPLEAGIKPGETVTFWNIPYHVLEDAGINSDYNYVLGMLTSGIMVYVLITICLTLVERLIDVIGLYLIGPFTLSRCPLDDGNSFNLWKDLVITRLLSAGGIIIFMYLYFLLMGNMLNWFAPLQTDSSRETIAKNMVKIFFVIGGAFSAKKGALMVAQMISQNAGIAEGMSQSQSLHMLSSGLAIGSRALFGAMSGIGRGALMAGRGGAAAGGSALRGAMAGAGGANVPVKAGDGGIIGGAPGTVGGDNGAASAAPMLARNAAAPVAAAAGMAGGGYGGGASGNAGGANIPATASDGAIMTGGADVTAQPGAVADGAYGNGDAGIGGAFQNPYLPGKAGEIARTNRGFASAREAMLYSGFSGALGYGIAKGVGGLTSAVGRAGAAIGSKIKAAYGKTDFAQNRAALKDAKAKGREAQISKKRTEKGVKGVMRQSARETNKLTPKNRDSANYDYKMDKQLKRDYDRINKVNDKIQKKFGKSLQPFQIHELQNQANKHRMDQLDKKLKKFQSLSSNGDALTKRFDAYKNASTNRGGKQ